jgi:hypothetical protein
VYRRVTWVPYDLGEMKDGDSSMTENPGYCSRQLTCEIRLSMRG